MGFLVRFRTLWTLNKTRENQTPKSLNASRRNQKMEQTELLPLIATVRRRSSR